MSVFEIEYHRGGTLLQRFRVPSFGGAPSMQPIKVSLDARLRTALGKGVWTAERIPCDVIRMDLLGARSQPLGTLFARKLGKKPC